MEIHPVESDSIEITEETARFRARDVKYVAGPIERILLEVPEFEFRPFREGTDGPDNPFLKTIVRLPQNQIERPIPVGVVSNSYMLAPHRLVIQKCLEGLRVAGIETRGLRAELGLSTLGEWMNIRIYFPGVYKKSQPDGKHDIALRLECFNSVDGSSRLVMLLGWFRFVCSNGMIVGDTKTELRDIHDEALDLDAISLAIVDGMKLVKADLDRLNAWQQTKVSMDATQAWVDNELTGAWGKKAASRVFHICQSGKETEFADPFAKGSASEKQVKFLSDVPGSRFPADNLYAVSQALSWVGTRRNNPDQRVDWLYQIPTLLNELCPVHAELSL